MRQFLIGAYLLVAAISGAYMLQAWSGPENECFAKPTLEQKGAAKDIFMFSVADLQVEEKNDDESSFWDVNITIKAFPEFSASSRYTIRNLTLAEGAPKQVNYNTPSNKEEKWVSCAMRAVISNYFTGEETESIVVWNEQDCRGTVATGPPSDTTSVVIEFSCSSTLVEADSELAVKCTLEQKK